MSLLYLTAGELLAVFGIVGGLIAALYFFDRAPKRRAVVTLRFFPVSGVQRQTSRRKMNNPWSLVLQLAGLLCFLLAAAGLQWGSHTRPRDHVIILDASASSQAKVPGSSTSVLGREKQLARSYFNRLPPADRIMLVAAGSVPVRLTPFTADRNKLSLQLARLEGGFDVADVGRALSFAQSAQAESGNDAGEITYTGTNFGVLPQQGLGIPFRWVRVSADRENCGIVSLAAQVDPKNPGSWTAAADVKNYGAAEHTVRVKSSFGSTSFRDQVLSIPAGAQRQATYSFAIHGSGLLSSQIVSKGDSLPVDDEAVLPLRQRVRPTILLFTNRPNIWTPLIASQDVWDVRVHSPQEFSTIAHGESVLLDGFIPPQQPAGPAVWLNPPPGVIGPVTVNQSAVKGELSWVESTDLTFAEPHRNLSIPSAHLLHGSSSAKAIAVLPQGPVALTEGAGNNRQAYLGFDLMSESFRFQVAAPLLLGSLMQWLSPPTGKTGETAALPVGLVKLPISGEGSELRAEDETGQPIPISVHSDSVEFSVSRPAIIRFGNGNHEQLEPVTLARVSSQIWSLPDSAVAGLPDRLFTASKVLPLWKWFTLAGLAVLALEWILFGRSRQLFSSTPRSENESKAMPAPVVEEPVAR